MEGSIWLNMALDWRTDLFVPKTHQLQCAPNKHIKKQKQTTVSWEESRSRSSARANENIISLPLKIPHSHHL